MKQLTSLGVKLYRPNESEKLKTWEELAGYENIKIEIMNNIILPYKYPSVSYILM